MRLDSGFLYVGEFLDGHIRTGTLYTPTYTYEGEFNEHGRAHGEGNQTYLINEPRLTFTGIWENGAMLRGACVDEYGSPVDWQNNHALQSSVLGDPLQNNGDLNVAVNSYCDAKLKEADSLHKEMSTSFAEDAQQVLKATGAYPSKADLGYEGGRQLENEALAQSQQKQLQDMDNMKGAFEAQAKEYISVADQLKDSVIGEINENMAKIQFTRQKGANQLASERVDEQFERFLKTFDRHKKDEDAKKSSLHIEGNAPWKSFVPPSS
ncbi:hypothetical protein STCU_06034 [Strigomonas culicis]|nr:hypothetical protein STCU_06034 [Strigomonas culicis]|eukprot:EPY26876.1 hypothetical protein STCU_06034 [Strigomonas culicis]